VLADIGRNDGVAVGHFLEHVEDVLHLQAALYLVVERVLGFVAIKVLEPVAGVKFANVLGQFFNELTRVAMAIMITLDHSAEL